MAHLAVVRTRHAAAFAEGLRERGVCTDVHYPIPDYRQKVIGVPALELPVTEAACTQILTVPCFPEIEHEEIETVCDALGEVAESL